MSYLITNFGLEGATEEMPEGLRRQGLKPYAAYPREWYNYLLGHHDRAYKAHIRSRMHKFYDAGEASGGLVVPSFGSGILRVKNNLAALAGQGMDLGETVDLGFTPTIIYGTPGDPSTGDNAWVAVSDGTTVKSSENGGLSWTGVSTGAYHLSKRAMGNLYISNHGAHRYLIRRNVAPYLEYGNPYVISNTSMPEPLASFASSVTRFTVSDTEDLGVFYQIDGTSGNVLYFGIPAFDVKCGYIAQFPVDASRNGLAVRYFKGYYWVSEFFNDDTQRLRCYRQPKPWDAGFTQLHLLEPDYEFEEAKELGHLRANENMLVWGTATTGDVLVRNRVFFHPTDYEDVLTPGFVSVAPRRLYYQDFLNEARLMMTELL